MTEEGFTLKLTHDQALVLSDWLDRMIGTADFDTFVNQDRAVWSPLYRISGALETSLVEVFSPDYAALLAAARERLLDTLGEVGRPVEDDGQP
ncbi:hypothetical protein [Catellatospora paridis]|uniref:hypothetical protein n=1 Tax=Catellatospora paridis TaxID=1617086 RepID=UPI0012D4094A|nr:hypothetical protein [Catellatospora paridis]